MEQHPKRSAGLWRLAPLRLMYVAKFAEAVYVLHVFQKKTKKTLALDLAVARRRFALVRRTREEK